MKKMKNKLNDEMGRFKGVPKGACCEVLDEMMHAKANSRATSSIPLAEFWQQARKVAGKSAGEVTLGHVCHALEMGSRVVLLIRHAERPPRMLPRANWMWYNRGMKAFEVFCLNGRMT